MSRNVLWPLFFTKNLMFGKGMLDCGNNDFFRMYIGFSDEVDGLLFFMNLESFFCVIEEDRAPLFCR